jgi:hypothetical protein
MIPGSATAHSLAVPAIRWLPGLQPALHSIVARYKAIVAASIEEVVVFHSAENALLRFSDDLPFPVMADPEKRLYQELGVEPAARALFDPPVWGPILRGVLRSALAVLRKEQPVPHA